MGIDSHLPCTSSLIFRTRVQQVKPGIVKCKLSLAYHLNQSTNEKYSILISKGKNCMVGLLGVFYLFGG